MKGLENNEQANNTFNKILLSLNNSIRSIYNLGYREGYKDGLEEATHQIVDKLLMIDELKETKDEKEK